jgi:signal transduction histidine kinase
MSELFLGVLVTLCFTGVIIYFTQRIKAQQSRIELEQARLKASIDSLNVGFLMTDPKGEVLTINGAAKRILCLNNPSGIPGALHNLAAVNFECNIGDIEEKLKHNLSLKTEILKSLSERTTLVHEDINIGEIFLHIFITPIVLAQPKLQVIGAVVLIEDVTQEKLIEKSKDDFFSIASHELRTPLTAIRGNSSLIMQYYADKITDPDLKEMVEDIHESSERLIGLVNDFLDTSRLEQGRITFHNQAFNAFDIATSCLEELKSQALEKKISLELAPGFELLPMAFADPDRVRQVLLNLGGNAIKFTTEGGVTIKGTSDAEFIKIAVADTGRGILEKDQSSLFKKFQQASDNPLIRDSKRSTGLGLYISKLMIEGMGGKIWLDSSASNQGSVFEFSLPIAENNPK